MSARSITHVHEMKSLDPNETIVCSFYRNSGGQLEGHGRDLAYWLDSKRLINGIDSNYQEGRDFNGAGTMAVQLMAYIQAISDCEVIPTGSTGYGEEYIYDVYFRNGGFVLMSMQRIYNTAKKLL